MSTEASNAPHTPPSGPPLGLPTSPGSIPLGYYTFNGRDLTDEVLAQCAKLFGENYGVWGRIPEGQPGKEGARVKMTGPRLRKQCVSSPESTVLAVCYKGPVLVGHAFATVWDYPGGRVGWVTQLVVSVEVRKRYIATSLLKAIKDNSIFQNIQAVGLVSSHPATCAALSKYTSSHVDSVDLTFCQKHAQSILDGLPITYVRGMELRGTLFDPQCTTGAVSSVFTNFWVDHEEPLAALAEYRERGNWVLGNLLDGHEYLIILPV